MSRLQLKSLKLFAVVLLFHVRPCFGYSVLTHEAIIDVTWNKVLVPLIREKFPGASAEQIQKARAYAYGGVLAPDMGYYPFGSSLFSNLVHYVRNGDFIETLLSEASNANEYAFALGMLCHYFADINGHGIAVNKSVPLMYPKMEKQFGNTVTYADDRMSHIRTEFSFDVVQIGKGNYLPQSYHDFIGFQIARELLERAFYKTYGLELTDLFGDFDIAVGTFRWSVKEMIPAVTRAAWKMNKKEIRKLNASSTRHRYIYRLRRTAYYHEFGHSRIRERLGTFLLSFLIRISPKIGPLKILKFRPTVPEAEKKFLKSFDETVASFTIAVQRISRGDTGFTNVDWDTGKKTAQGEYSLADQTYCEWVLRAKEKNFRTLTPSAKKNILAFYQDSSTDPLVDSSKWQLTTAALRELRTKD